MMPSLLQEDLDLIRCPRCGGSLEPTSGSLRCVRCQAIYEVRGGIPDLLPWSGGVAGQEWARWRERLDAVRSGGRAQLAQREIAEDVATDFFKFARVPESGTVLEIGCGSTALRRYVPRRRYWGLDPLAGMAGMAGAPGGVETSPAPASAPTAAGTHAEGVVLLRGIGERLPLADASFDTVLVCETLDQTLDPGQVIREAHRVLKLGGLLAVMQSVRLEMPRPSLGTRFWSAATRSASRLTGGPTGTTAPDTAPAIGQDDLSGMVKAEMLVESGITRGTVMFLRALKQDLAAPRRPKRDVGA
jgi:SAM-dependent methyltransferase